MLSTNTLGRYHIIREIARSNDIVYEAMDPQLGKRIALKELQMPGNLAGQARRERIQRFTREARAAAGLQHTSIVRIYDHGSVQDRYYIAMEFLEGQSLRDVLRQRGAMPVQEALRIAAAVAEGLEFAHSKGVIHRDVKPDNVHLEPDGRVVITDFGIARLTFEPTLTADGQIFGTPSYMSPEQVTGKGIDRRSDVFSLGVMLYEMIAGRKPFTGDSVITITYNIMNTDPPPLAGAGIPPGLEQVLRCAMAKEPGSRYANAGQMAEDLRAIARGGAPRHARTPAPRPPAHPPAGYSAPPPSRPGPAPYSPPRSAPPPPFRPANGGPAGAGPGGVRPGFPPPPGVPHRRPGPSRGYTPPPIAAPYGGGAPVAISPNSVLGQRRAQQQQAWSNAAWLLGWLGIAVVLGLLIIAIVWATVNAQQSLRDQASRRAANETQVVAEKAFAARHYEQAMKGYLDVAKDTTGLQQQRARKNAAVAAIELARERRKAGRLQDAVRLLTLATKEWDPDSPSAYVELGQVLADQGKIDDALAAFDETGPAAERLQQSGVPADEVASARKAASYAPLWKAEVLYNDGLKQKDRNPELARTRFRDAAAAAPKSTTAQNAKAQLSRMGADENGAPSSAPQPDGDVPPRPENWNFRSPFQ